VVFRIFDLLVVPMLVGSNHVPPVFRGCVLRIFTVISMYNARIWLGLSLGVDGINHDKGTVLVLQWGCSVVLGATL
jgi:hypothetical protein